MKGDFAGFVERLKNFIGVLLQQGRPQRDSDAESQYVTLRRIALFLEETLGRALQWALFEPNGDKPRRRFRFARRR